MSPRLPSLVILRMAGSQLTAVIVPMNRKRNLNASIPELTLDYPEQSEGLISEQLKNMAQQTGMLVDAIHVRLAEPHCRYFILQNSDALGSQDQAIALAGIRFREIFGESTQGWSLVALKQPLTSSWFACASPIAMINDFKALQRDFSTPTIRIESDLVCAFNSCCDEFPWSNASFIYVTDTRTHICDVKRGELHSADTYPDAPTSVDELRAVIQKHERMSGRPVARECLILAPFISETDKDSSMRDTYRLVHRPVDALDLTPGGRLALSIQL